MHDVNKTSGNSFHYEEELSLRPNTLSEFIGQDKLKAGLNICIQAARSRHEPLSHVLICGAPGLGKTTLAGVIAAEMGQNIRIISGRVFKRAGEMVSILTNLSAGDVLFIDEIDRLCRDVEEVLHPVMEEFVLDLVIGRGPSARSLRLDISHFTLIGATTRPGMLPALLRDRFGINLRLDLYTPEQLTQIVERSAKLLGTECDHEGAMEIARRSRGTPRVANRLLHRVRDFAEMRGDGRITKENARGMLDIMEIDELGLDNTDITLLRTMVERFDGGPVGLNTLAAVIGEDASAIEDMREPYLRQLGFLTRMPKGLVCTPAAYGHLGIPIPGTGDE